MNLEKLTLEQYRTLMQESKAQIQLWDKTQVINLKYVGIQTTARATVAVYDGFTIRYAGAGAGTVAVAEDTVTISGNGTPTVYDLTNASYDTIGELVAVIDGLGDWTCVKGANIATSVPSKHLAILTATDCKTGDVICLMDNALFVEAPNATPDTNVGIDGKIFLRNTSYDTLAELVAFLDGLADYTCTLGTQFDGTDLSSNLASMVATSIKTSSGLWLAGSANLQIKITVPAETADKSLKLTAVLGASSYGSGTSFFQVYDGAELKWSEAAGANGIEKVSTLPGLTITPGNQAVIKIINSAAMTAGYLTIGYDEKQQGPYKM